MIVSGFFQAIEFTGRSAFEEHNFHPSLVIWFYRSYNTVFFSFGMISRPLSTAAKLPRTQQHSAEIFLNSSHEGFIVYNT